MLTYFYHLGCLGIMILCPTGEFCTIVLTWHDLMILLTLLASFKLFSLPCTSVPTVDTPMRSHRPSTLMWARSLCQQVNVALFTWFKVCCQVLLHLQPFLNMCMSFHVYNLSAEGFSSFSSLFVCNSLPLPGKSDVFELILGFLTVCNVF